MKSEENKKAENKSVRGVLMEDLDVKLDLVLEGYSALDKKIDQHHEEFVEFRSETNFKFEFIFDELRNIHGDLKDKLDRAEFESFQKNIGNLKNA